MQGRGVIKLDDIAAELNARGVKTPRDGAWFATSVRRVMARA
jgi:hypothetical protein